MPLALFDFHSIRLNNNYLNTSNRSCSMFPVLLWSFIVDQFLVSVQLSFHDYWNWSFLTRVPRMPLNFVCSAMYPLCISSYNNNLKCSSRHYVMLKRAVTTVKSHYNEFEGAARITLLNPLLRYIQYYKYWNMNLYIDFREILT